MFFTHFLSTFLMGCPRLSAGMSRPGHFWDMRLSLYQISWHSLSKKCLFTGNPQGSQSMAWGCVGRWFFPADLLGKAKKGYPGCPPSAQCLQLCTSTRGDSNTQAEGGEKLPGCTPALGLLQRCCRCQSEHSNTGSSCLVLTLGKIYLTVRNTYVGSDQISF